MPTVGDVARHHVVTVLTTTRVGPAAQLMAELGVGGVIVTDPETGAVTGMLTDRDIATRVVGRQLDVPHTEVGEVCTSDPVTLRADQDEMLVWELMEREAVRRIPVVDAEGRPVGVVSIEDLADSEHVTDERLRTIMRSLAVTYRRRRIGADNS